MDESCNIYCINDVPLAISGGNEINLFVDDIVLCRIIKAPTDYDHLQHDVDSILSCTIMHFMKTSTQLAKCRQMFIIRRKVHSLPPPCV